MKNLKLITHYDVAFRDFGNISAASIAMYSVKWGFDYQIYRNILSDRPPAWLKIALLIEEIKNGDSDYVMWVDADAVFCRLDASILEGIDFEKNLYLTKHCCTHSSLAGMPGMYLQLDRPNSGVMLVKKSEWSLNFFQQVWGMTEYINSGWWEQSAIHKLLGCNYEISNGTEMNRFNESILEHVGWLDVSWNNVPTISEITKLPIVVQSINPIINHFAGMSRGNRLNGMQASYRELLNGVAVQK